jgi:tetratricopeptide (TPR) repeat protein
VSGRAAAIAVVFLAATACEAPKPPTRETATVSELRPVTLPDMSKAASSVQDQIRTAYSTLMARGENPATPAAERAASYGELGKLFMAADFGQAAEACFLNAQLLAPGDARWPYFLGHLYKAQGTSDKSIASFERAVQLRPDDVPALIWLGDAYLALDRHADAEARFARARSLQPRSVAALGGLGRVALAKREYAAAARTLGEALGIDPQATSLHYPLGMAYRGLGDLAKAEVHLKERGKGDVAVPDPLMQEVRGLLRSATSFESLGVAALERGDSAGAAMYFRKGLEVAPDNASLHHRLGTALFLSGDALAGEKEFEAAIRIDPGFARAHYSLGVLMASMGRYQPAVDRLSAAVKSDPDYLEALLALGDLLRQGGRPGESLPHYARIISIAPGIVEARLGQALALVSMGRYREARDLLAEALKVQANQPALGEALARVLAAAPDDQVRDGRRAVSVMQELVEGQPSPEVIEAMAIAYAEVGEYQQAVAWQRRAIGAAERAGRDSHSVKQMTENLRLFEQGKPCRTPWREGTMP